LGTIERTRIEIPTHKQKREIQTHRDAEEKERQTQKDTQERRNTDTQRGSTEKEIYRYKET
jgi:hypothetical protein